MKQTLYTIVLKSGEVIKNCRISASIGSWAQTFRSPDNKKYEAVNIESYYQQ